MHFFGIVGSKEIFSVKREKTQAISNESDAVIKNSGIDSLNVQVFFDLEKNDFRSFTIGTECSIIGFEEI